MGAVRQTSVTKEDMNVPVGANTSSHSPVVEAQITSRPSRLRISLRAWPFSNSDETTSIGMGVSTLHTSFNSCWGVGEHLDRRISIKFIQRARHRRLRAQRLTSSMAKILVFAISMSKPISGLISRVSVWSRNNIPRRLTLIWPRASCTTTCCPIHQSNAFCMSSTTLFRGAGSMGDSQSDRYC
jgi:hypothetical protein